MTMKYYFLQIWSVRVSKNPEFYADFESGKIIAKKYTEKKKLSKLIVSKLGFFQNLASSAHFSKLFFQIRNQHKILYVLIPPPYDHI